MRTMAKKTNIKEILESLLVRIKEKKQKLEDIQRMYMEELESLQKRYGKSIEDIKEGIRKDEQELQKLALRYKNEVFVGDIAELQNGRLIYQVKVAVKRIRGMLERLEQLGWTEAIIIEKKVNWAEIEKWTDERLIALGTERVVKETVSYELK